MYKKFQTYKGRVVQRGDVVKNDSGSCAVFTEQESSASHMTAAKVLDVIPRLPGCAGQASGAVSAYTQVKMEDAPKLLGLPETECLAMWIRPPRARKHKLARISDLSRYYQTITWLGEIPRGTLAWSYDMEGNEKSCVEMYCELANKKIEQLYKGSTLCMDDHPFKNEEFKTV